VAPSPSYAVEDSTPTSVDIMREAILNQDVTSAWLEFAENAMRIYDVDVLGLEFVDTMVQKQLDEAQRAGIRRGSSSMQRAWIAAPQEQENVVRPRSSRRTRRPRP